jgi:hypothetical protein
MKLQAAGKIEPNIPACAATGGPLRRIGNDNEVPVLPV